MPACASLSIVGLLMALPRAGDRGDEIADLIDHALKGGETQAAATAHGLDAATLLVREARAKAREALLPTPLVGWTAGNAAEAAVGNALPGGGITLSRTYRKSGQSIEIAVIAESPVLQGIGTLMSRGVIASGELRPMIIAGREFTYRRSENSYTTLIGDAIVSVKGDPADDVSLRAYLGAIAFAACGTAAAAKP